MKDGRDGLLFDPDEPDGLARALRPLFGDRSRRLRERLVAGGRRTAEQCSLLTAVDAERALLAEVAEV